MPPLKAEKFEATRLTTEEFRYREELRLAKNALFGKMDGILPQGKRIVSFAIGSVVESPKAIYQHEDESEDIFTRAWLVRNTVSRMSHDSMPIHLFTDRVTLGTDEAVSVVKDSRVRQLGLGSTGEMYTDLYSDFNDRQVGELLGWADDTVALIQTAQLQSNLRTAQPA